MAFDVNKKKVQNPGVTADVGSGNPYDELMGGSMPVSGSSAAPMGGEGGASQTGYVNFGDYFNANAGAAQKGAANLQTSAAGKGQAAQSGLSGAEGQYGQAVKAGTPQGPTGYDFQRASTGSSAAPEAVAPSSVTVSAPPPAGQSSTSPAVNPDGSVSAGAAPRPTSQPAVPGAFNTTRAPTGSVSATTPQGPESQDDWRARMQAKAAAAQAGYTGPNALSDMAGYSDLLNSTTAAQDEANALASGNSGIAGALQGSANTSADAALLGAAGRPGFVDLGHKYGGLVNSLNSADASSQNQSALAKQNAQGEANQYGLLLDHEQGVQKDIASANAAKAARAGAAPPVDPSDGFTPEQWAQAQQDEQKWGDNVGKNAAVGANNQGFGFGDDDMFKDLGGQQGINITATKDANGKDVEDTKGWWGGADGPELGDGSLSAQQWYALGQMTPQQRSDWWNKHHKKGG